MIWNCKIQWKDTQEVVSNVLITNLNLEEDGIPKGVSDHQIFFYGLNPEEAHGSVGSLEEEFEIIDHERILPNDEGIFQDFYR